MQLDLFDRDGGRKEKLATVKREIRGMQGRFAVRSAATLPLFEVYRDGAAKFGYLRCPGKDCA